MADTNLKVKFIADIRQMTEATQQIESRLGNFGQTVKRIGAMVAGAFAVREVVSFGKELVAAAEESQKIARQTEAVIKSTGGAARVSAQDVASLANELSRMSGIDDELIQSGQNVLLTFTNIRNAAGKGNDIFNQATKAALDMSVALGQDLQSSVIQLGKALNDPIKGITALQRVGVSFTAQQREQIKVMVESGDVLSAQKMILAELTKEFGGSAAAQATATARLRVAWENLKEDLGAKLLPVVETVAQWLADHLPRALDLVERALEKVEPVIARVARGLADVLFPRGVALAEAALERFGPVAERVARQMADRLPPALVSAEQAFREFQPVVERALQAFGADVADKAKAQFAKLKDIDTTGFQERLRKAFTSLDLGDLAARAAKAWPAIVASFSGVGEQFVGAVKQVVAIVTALWDAMGDELIDIVKTIGQGIVEVLRAVFEIVGGLIKFWLALINGDWGAAWKALKQTVDGVWDAIIGLSRMAWKVIGQVFEAGLSALKLAWDTAWHFLRGPVTDAVDWIKRNWDVLLTILTGPIGAVILVWRRFGDDIRDAVGGAIDAVVGWIKRNWDILLTILTGPIGAVILVWRRFGDDIKEALGAAFDAVKNAATSVFNTIKSIVGDVATWFANRWEEVRGAFQAVWDAMRSVVETVWGAITGIITGVINGIKEFLTREIEGFKKLWHGLQEAASAVWDAIKSAASAAWEGIKAIVSGVINGIKEFLRHEIQGWQNIWDGLKDAFGKVWDEMKKKVSDIWEGIKDIVQKAIDAIKDWLKGLLGPLKEALDLIGSIASKVGGAVGGVVKKVVPGQHGIRNFQGGLALVGEAGPELLELPRGANVIPLNRSTGPTPVSMEPTTVLHVTVNALDPRSAAQAVVQAIEEWELRNGRRFARVS
jgi:phage-related protein/cell division septum initiation protein DivIVA